MDKLTEEGGMADDGLTKEPMTGNEVPPGALASEVRDDVDAKLSEGEYVIPADVVRFFGVKFFENLRSKAKQGLMDMEAEGRIGGNAVDSQGVPLEDPEDELTPEEEQMLEQALASSGMAEGGLAFDRTKFTMPNYGADGMGSPIESRQYFNPTTGEKQTVSFMNGAALGAIPEGFVPWSQSLEDTFNANKAAIPVVAPQQTPSGSNSNNTEQDANDPTSSSFNYSSWADKNYDAITSNPFEFGMNALDDTSGKLGSKALGVAGLATGLLPLAVAGRALSSGSKIQNVAEANAALKLMEANGLSESPEYNTLTEKVKAYISDLSTAEQAMLTMKVAGTGDKYVKSITDKSGVTTPPSTTATPSANPIKPVGSSSSSATRVPVPNTTPTAQAPTTSSRPKPRSDDTEARAIAKANAATGASKVVQTPSGSQRVSIPTTAPTNTITKTVNTPSGPKKVTEPARVSQAARAGFVDGGLVTKPTKTNPKSKGLGGKQ